LSLTTYTHRSSLRHLVLVSLTSLLFTAFCIHYRSNNPSPTHHHKPSKTNPYVIVYALDFSKAFDSVRQSAVLEKYSRLSLPDNIYNWVEAFFRDHEHCTRFGENVSQFRSIFASIIQGSAIGPVSYVITASDLQPVVSGNYIDKYADDTYLIIAVHAARVMCYRDRRRRNVGSCKQPHSKLFQISRNCFRGKLSGQNGRSKLELAQVVFEWRLAIDVSFDEIVL